MTPVPSSNGTLPAQADAAPAMLALVRAGGVDLALLEKAAEVERLGCTLLQGQQGASSKE